jgi:transcriptional regulator with XRE-family HTH domain
MPATPSEPLSLATVVFGQRVRTRRQALGWSQERLAEEAGIHWTYVGQIERGRRNVTLHNILRLAQGLGCNPAELVDGLTYDASA